jgi:hypothetical protein
LPDPQAWEAAELRRAYLKLATGVLALLLIGAIWVVWRLG